MNKFPGLIVLLIPAYLLAVLGLREWLVEKFKDRVHVLAGVVLGLLSGCSWCT